MIKSQRELRLEGARKGAATYGTLENSYGNVYIQEDLERGVSKKEVIRRIMERYPDIKIEQATSIVEAIIQGKPTDWSHK